MRYDDSQDGRHGGQRKRLRCSRLTPRSHRSRHVATPGAETPRGLCRLVKWPRGQGSRNIIGSPGTVPRPAARRGFDPRPYRFVGSFRASIIGLPLEAFKGKTSLFNRPFLAPRGPRPSSLSHRGRHCQSSELGRLLEAGLLLVPCPAEQRRHWLTTAGGTRRRL
jgi:hypothetical protein